MTEFETSFLRKHQVPDFFSDTDPVELETLHSDIKVGIEKATETLKVEIREEIIKAAEQYFSRISWTLEEAMVLYVKWVVACPDYAKAYLGEIMEGDKNEQV